MKKLIKTIFWAYLFAFIGFIGGYLVRVIATRNLNPSDFGLSYLIISLSGFFIILFDLGTTQALVYLYQKAKNKAQKAEIIFNYLVFEFINLAVVILLIFLTKNLILNFFHIPGSLFFVFLFVITSYMLFNLASAIFLILINPIRDKLIGSLRILFWLFFSLFFFYSLNERNSKYFLLAFSLSALLVGIVSLFYFLRELSNNLVKKVSINKTLFKEFLKIGIPLVFTGMISFILFYLDSIVIGHYLKHEYYSYFNLAYAFLSFPLFLFSSLASYLFPLTAKNKDLIKNKFFNLVYLLLFIVLPFSIAFFLFSKEIVIVLYTKKYLFSHVILKIFSLFLIFFVLMNYLNSIVQGLKELSYLLKTYFFVSLVVVLLDLLAVYTTKSLIALELIALSTSLSWLLLSLFFYLKIKDKLNLKVPNWFIKKTLRLLISLPFLALFIFVAKELINLNNLWLKFFVVAIVSSIFYLFLVVLFKLIPEDVKDLLLSLNLPEKVKVLIEKL